jgi:Transglutaminase-like superfamily
MNKRALIVAAVVAAITAASTGPVAAAPGHLSKRAQIAHLSTVNRELRMHLRNMTVARNNAKAELATANGQIGSLQSQNAALQASLRQRTSERDAALAQVASLKAQIAAVPTPLSVAVAQVQREVGYAEWYPVGAPYSHGRLVAQAAMDYVVGHVSLTAYGYLAVFGGALPGQTPDSVLGKQAGICGHAALAFAAIVKRLGLAARSVQFYFQDPTNNAPNSHIAAEVFYDGGWHYFDPTYGLFWTDANGSVLPIADVRGGSGTEQKDTLAMTNLVQDTHYGDATAFVTDPATVVAIDKQPFTG